MPLEVSLIVSAETPAVDAALQTMAGEVPLADGESETQTESDPVAVPQVETEPIDGIVPPVEPLVNRVYYLQAAELHQRPIPLERVDLSALARQFPGAQARFDVHISAQGRVDEVHIRSTTDPAMAEQYRLSLLATGFVPGKIAEQPVASELRIEIRLPVVIPADPQLGRPDGGVANR